MPARKPEATNTKTGGNVAGGGYSVGKNMTAKSKAAAAKQTKAAKTYMNPSASAGKSSGMPKGLKRYKQTEAVKKYVTGAAVGAIAAGSSKKVDLAKQSGEGVRKTKASVGKSGLANSAKVTKNSSPVKKVVNKK